MLDDLPGGHMTSLWRFIHALRLDSLFTSLNLPGFRPLTAYPRISHLHAWTFTFVLLAMGLSDFSFAQSLSPLAASYIRTDFTVEDGLPDNVVNAVIRPGNGLLWVGTESGLSTFDGQRFKRVDFSFRGVPSIGSVHAFAQASNGDLWVGSDAGLTHVPKKGLNQVDPATDGATFLALGRRSDDVVQNLLATAPGTLWVGTNHGLYSLVSGRVKKLALDGSIDLLSEAADGHLLIVSEGRFLEFDGNTLIRHAGIERHLGIGVGDLYTVFQDRHGTMWYGTKRGLMREGEHPVPLIQPVEAYMHKVFRANEDARGNLWISSSGGTFRVNGNQLEALSSPEVDGRCFYAGPDGDLWMGTNGAGLLHFKPRLVKMYTKADSLPNNTVMTVLADHLGSLWLGNNCGGITHLSEGRLKRYSEKDGLTNSCVWTLAEDHVGNLWIGTYNGGLYKFRGGHFTQITVAQGLVDNVVFAIIVARDDSLWIATPNGLSHLAKGQITNYTKDQGLSSNHILGIHQDEAGTIWVASQGGIDRLTEGGFKHLSSNIFAPGDSVTGFAEDSHGDLYAANSLKGLGLIKNNQVFLVNDDLNVMDEVEDFDSNLWLSSRNGVIRVALDDLRGSVTGRNSPLNYYRLDREDGLNSTQSSVGTPNIAITPDQKLWIATVKGLAMVNLKDLPSGAHKPNVFVSEVSVDGKKQSSGSELTLPAGTHHVELSLAAVDLDSPEKTRIQYRMDGVDLSWLDADLSRTAIYTSIPLGEHEFHVRTTDSAGTWDRLGIVYTVSQQPLFYERRLFQLACGALILLLASIGYLVRVQNVVAQTRIMLEARIAERETIARDLHDSFFQGIQGLLLSFNLGTSRLGKGDPVRALFEENLILSDQVMLEGRKLVLDLRTRGSESSELVADLEAAAAEFTKDNPGRFAVKVTGSSRKLDPAVSEEIYKIGREAISNAFRHAHAKLIEVEFTYGPREVRLNVRDDGKGIPEQVMKDGSVYGHFGLPGMAERAEKVGARFAMFSRAGGGTEIEVRLSSRLAYRSRRAHT